MGKLVPNRKKIVDIAIYTKNGFRKNHRYRRQQKKRKERYQCFLCNFNKAHLPKGNHFFY